MSRDQIQRRLRRWAIPVALTVAISALVGLWIGRSTVPLYQATGKILVFAAPQQSSLGSILYVDVNQATKTTATLITTRPVLARAVADAHLAVTPEDIAGEITVSPEANTQIVDISVTDARPDRARTITNALMAAYIDTVRSQNQKSLDDATASVSAQIADLQKRLTAAQAALATAQQAHSDVTQVEGEIQADTALLTQFTGTYTTLRSNASQTLNSLRVAEPAALPLVPVSPRPLVNTLLGAFVGLFVGFGLALLSEYLNQSLDSEDDVRERVRLPVLGVIPRFAPRSADAHRPPDGYAGDMASEAYHRLRTSFLFSGVSRSIRSVLVTSVHSGEGKSRTAASLARVLAASGQRVLLVDADMRRPAQHSLFGRPLEGGLSELLLGARGRSLPAHRQHPTSERKLRLITAGTLPPNPAELLASPKTAALLRQLERSFDVVVIDAPPLDLVSDALNLAATTSAVLLVVEAGKTSSSAVNGASSNLAKVGATLLGVVLNRVRTSSPRRYGEGHAYLGTTRRTLSGSGRTVVAELRRRLAVRRSGGADAAAPKIVAPANRKKVGEKPSKLARTTAPSATKPVRAAGSGRGGATQITTAPPPSTPRAKQVRAARRPSPPVPPAPPASATPSVGSPPARVVGSSAAAPRVPRDAALPRKPMTKSVEAGASGRRQKKTTQRVLQIAVPLPDAVAPVPRVSKESATKPVDRAG